MSLPNPQRAYSVQIQGGTVPSTAPNQAPSKGQNPQAPTRLALILAEHNHTQTYVAHRLSISTPQFSRYYNGISPLPIEVIVALCQFYNTSPTAIVGNAELLDIS